MIIQSREKDLAYSPREKKQNKPKRFCHGLSQRFVWELGYCYTLFIMRFLSRDITITDDWTLKIKIPIHPSIYQSLSACLYICLPTYLYLSAYLPISICLSIQIVIKEPRERPILSLVCLFALFEFRILCVCISVFFELYMSVYLCCVCYLLVHMLFCVYVCRNCSRAINYFIIIKLV